MSGRQKTLKLAVTIVERGHGNNIAALYDENQVRAHYHCSGQGTASSELLDLFGFGTSERDILLSLAPGADVDRLLSGLREALRGSVRTKGIAFSLKLSAMNTLAAMALLEGSTVNEGEGISIPQNEKGYCLILASVDQGFTDDVMNTAREAGARGGTIIRARWAGGKSVEQFYGLTFQEEKELIAIVAAQEKQAAIMEAVNKKHGLRSEAHGMLCSLQVDQVARLG